MKLYDLRTEYRENPIGLTEKAPRFSWKIESDEKDTVQTSYEIKVTDENGKLVWGCIAASIGILGSCRNKQVQVDIPQLVKTAPVNGHDGITSVTYPGKIQAASNVKLAFRVAGPIRKIYVNEGQYVKKGQLLAELDPRDYQLYSHRKSF